MAVLFGIDLMQTVKAGCAADHPVLLSMAEPTRVATPSRLRRSLRIVELGAALAARSDMCDDAICSR